MHMKRKQIRWSSLLLFMLITLSAMGISVHASAIQSLGGTKARVVMESFVVSDDMVVPGENFDLSFTLRNPSKVNSVDSVVLTFTNDIELVSPVYGQPDQIYIDSIPAGGMKNVKVTLKAADQILTSSIKFDIDVTYADLESSNNLDKISIQLPVTTKSKFEIQNVSFPQKVYAGTKTRMHITYKNAGVDDLYNITMNIESANAGNNQQVSLGSLIAGKVSYAEAYVDFKNIGEQVAKITFTYEDVEGNKYTTDPYEATFTALDSTQEDSIIPNHAGSTKNNGSINIVKIVLVLTIIAMGGVVWKLWNKYRK